MSQLTIILSFKASKRKVFKMPHSCFSPSIVLYNLCFVSSFVPNSVCWSTPRALYLVSSVCILIQLIFSSSFIILNTIYQLITPLFTSLALNFLLKYRCEILYLTTWPFHLDKFPRGAFNIRNIKLNISYLLPTKNETKTVPPTAFHLSRQQLKSSNYISQKLGVIIFIV